jgi:uncharacterized Tic20 family protein
MLLHMETNTNKTTATLLHLSALSQYCFPFGNFLIPIMIWSSTREKSEYLDAQGKHVINFQLSMFLYSLILCLIAIPILLITILKNIKIHEMSNHHNFILENLNFENSGGAVVIALLSIVLFAALKVIEFVQIILAAIKISNGENHNYPFTIKFLK